MAHRKLQQEVDKVFKKINEGLDVFDTYYERHESCTNNPSQKDKLESDLKREVKKLQRLREQIKSWQSSPDIKDKDTLLEHRRRVEIAMEKYKAVEKASKEKAYSNISLKRAETLDPESKERLETENYLSRSIDELDRQYELLDVEIDRLQALNKKKKTYSQLNEEKIKSLRDMQLRYRWHQQQMELALRLVANEELSPQQVINIKDDINYFVENNQDDGFIEDETIYDDLDLQSNEAIAHEVSQYFSNQLSEDNKRANSGTTNGISGSSSSNAAMNTSESDNKLIDTSKLSKKELRKLEREAKKAAKLAAKNAAAESLSQGPTLTVKMSTKPPSPVPYENTRDTTPTQTTNKTSGSDEKNGISITTNNTSILATSSPLVKQTTNKSPNTTKDNHILNDTSISAVHTHIHQGANGVTGSTILKPATIPAKPVGDMKWSTAAAQSLKKDDEKQKNTVKQSSISSSQQSKAKLNDSTQLPPGTTTPRIGTPVTLNSNSVTTNIPLSKIGQLESLTSMNTNKSTTKVSSVTTTAGLAVGATAVNQNNQPFQKSQPTTFDQSNKAKVDTTSNNLSTTSQNGHITNNEPSVINTDNDKLLKEKKSDESDSIAKKEASESDSDDSSFYDFLDNDDDELLQEPQIKLETLDEIQTKEIKRTQLCNRYSDDYDLLTLPNGINEIIMEYEITKNKLFPNDGKLGGYRHSIDVCKIPRLYDIPMGVNPPNPLDAFRSAQQWDVIRTSIKDGTDFDKILEKFRGLEMFTLFYHYYFSVLPVERKIAFELLREKHWKVGNGETMWFLRQSDIKLQNELFEIADYKIFKLDDWSVIDKVNFRLDYANLKYPELHKYETSQLDVQATEELKTKINSSNISGSDSYNGKTIDNPSNNNATKSSSPNASSVNSASPNTLSHGQQLLQQLQRGRVTSDT